MILKAITLENFKGIREPVRIEFAPLTMLFGPNNSGKSTIIHALIYAREIFERGNTDPRKTEMGGDIVDLGGFHNLVNRHDLKKEIRIRFDLDFSPDNILKQGPRKIDNLDIANESVQDLWEHSDFVLGAPPSLRDVLGSLNLTWIEIHVAHSGKLQRPLVNSFSVGSGNNKPSIEINYDEEKQRAYLSVLDLGTIPLGKEQSRKIQQSINGPDSENILDSTELSEQEKQRFDSCTDIEDPMEDRRIPFQDFLKSILLPDCFSENGTIKWLPLQSFDSALPNRFVDMSLAMGYRFDSQHTHNAAKRNYWKHPWVVIHWFFEPLLTALAVGTSNCLRSVLVGSLYLSSARSVPQRDFHPVHPVDSRRWASGLAAWDILMLDDEHFVRRVNEWVSGKERFDTRYEIDAPPIRELDPDQFSKLKEKITPTVLGGILGGLVGGLPGVLIGATSGAAVAKDTKIEDEVDMDQLPKVKKLRIRDLSRDVLLTPQDVGYGLSQLVPVIVAALSGKCGIRAIEEPESNIHPAFQVVLGDLFISQANANKDAMFLVETHSEHLVLRIMRRMRETYHGKQTVRLAVTPADISILYVEREEDRTIVRSMPLNEAGELVKAWPGGFFEEGLKEQFGDD